MGRVDDALETRRRYGTRTAGTSKRPRRAKEGLGLALQRPTHQRHADQLGQAVGLHLGHDIRPIDLDVRGLMPSS